MKAKNLKPPTPLEYSLLKATLKGCWFRDLAKAHGDAGGSSNGVGLSMSITALLVTPNEGYPRPVKGWIDFVMKVRDGRTMKFYTTTKEGKRQMKLYRPLMDPRWLTTNVIDLATVIGQRDPNLWNREFKINRPDLLPILADALMDAGCNDEKVILTCRTYQELDKQITEATNQAKDIKEPWYGPDEGDKRYKIIYRLRRDLDYVQVVLHEILTPTI